MKRLVFKAKSQGFTLLEMLIATMLTAVVLGLVFSGMMTIQTSWAQSQRLQVEAQDIKVVDRFLRGRMSRILFLPTNEDGERIDFFVGQSDSFKYIAPMMTYVGFPGIYSQRIYLDGNQLMFEWQPYRKDAQQIEGESKRVLLTDVSDFKISYFGIENGQREGSWRDSWDLKKGTPNAVYIQYKYQGVAAPDIVVPLLW